MGHFPLAAAKGVIPGVRAIYPSTFFLGLIGAVVGVMLLVSGMDVSRPEPQVSVNLASQPAPGLAVAEEGSPLRIAVASMVSPGDTFLSYRELVRFVAEQVGREAELVLRPTYEEVNRLVLSGEVDLAFICSGAYADAAGEPGMVILVAPIVGGSRQYYSDIIVPPGSSSRSLEDLAGVRFAYVDELSNSGYSAPRRRLETLGLDPATFFAESIFTGSHDRSIEAVAAGLVEGAAVDSLILDGLRADKDPEAMAVIMVEQLGPFGMPPVVVSDRLAAPLREQLRDVFLGLADTQRGQEILGPLRIDGFRVPALEEYEDLVEAYRRGS